MSRGGNSLDLDSDSAEEVGTRTTARPRPVDIVIQSPSFASPKGNTAETDNLVAQRLEALERAQSANADTLSRIETLLERLVSTGDSQRGTAGRRGSISLIADPNEATVGPRQLSSTLVDQDDRPTTQAHQQQNNSNNQQQQQQHRLASNVSPGATSIASSAGAFARRHSDVDSGREGQSPLPPSGSSTTPGEASRFGFLKKYPKGVPCPQQQTKPSFQTRRSVVSSSASPTVAQSSKRPAPKNSISRQATQTRPSATASVYHDAHATSTAPTSVSTEAASALAVNNSNSADSGEQRQCVSPTSSIASSALGFPRPSDRLAQAREAVRRQRQMQLESRSSSVLVEDPSNISAIGNNSPESSSMRRDEYSSRSGAGAGGEGMASPQRSYPIDVEDDDDSQNNVSRQNSLARGGGAGEDGGEEGRRRTTNRDDDEVNELMQVTAAKQSA